MVVCDCDVMLIKNKMCTTKVQVLPSYQHYSVCLIVTLKATLNGSAYEDINLGRNIKTHVNDISTKFKTLSETGTLWMTNSPTNTDYIRVFLEDGVLKVKVKAGEVSIVYFHNN